MFHKCKIEVIDKTINPNLSFKFLKHPEKINICNAVEIGQKFIVNNPFEIPDGICASAWADIKPHILNIASGGSFDFLKDENTSIAICSDPFRPVVFKIERII